MNVSERLREWVNFDMMIDLIPISFASFTEAKVVIRCPSFNVPPTFWTKHTTPVKGETRGVQLGFNAGQEAVGLSSSWPTPMAVEPRVDNSPQKRSVRLCTKRRDRRGESVHHSLHDFFDTDHLLCRSHDCKIGIEVESGRHQKRRFLRLRIWKVYFGHNGNDI